MRKKKQAESLEKDLALFKRENQSLRGQLQEALDRVRSLDGEDFATRVRAFEFLLSSPAGAAAKAEAQAEAEEGIVSDSRRSGPEFTGLPSALSSAELATEWQTCVHEVLCQSDAMFRGLQKLRGALSATQLEALMQSMAARVWPRNEDERRDD